MAALQKIQEQPRETGEASIPEIGVILAVVDAMKVARINRESSAGRHFLARWKCPECSATQADFITEDDHRPRYCRTYGCHKPMEQTFRERAQ